MKNKAKQVLIKELVAEDWCFICKDGGELRICDYKQCLKAYHPTCVGKNDSFLESRTRWNCNWHSCFICGKSSDFYCYCCPKAVCIHCIGTSGSEFVHVRGKKGFCSLCLSVALLVEEKKDVDSDGEKVDFKDQDTLEFLFMDYWLLINKKEGFTAENLLSAKARLKMGNNYNPDADSDGHCTSEEDEPVSCSAVMSYTEEQKSKRKKSIGQSSPGTKMSKPNKSEVTGWGSKSLMQFLLSIGKDPSTNKLSQQDVADIVNGYIKDNSLFHPQKKKQVICDEKLQSIFRRKVVSKHRIFNLLKTHFAENLDSSDSEDDCAFSNSYKTDGDILLPCKKQRNSNVGVSSSHKEDLLCNVPQNCLASFVAENIKLIYLRRSLVKELLKQPETSESKIVKSFVRMKTDPNDFSQKNPYQLVQVTGIKKSSVGEKNTEILLQVSAIPKDIPVTVLSDDDFSEEEFEDLRLKVELGLVKNLTVGELEQKARILHEDQTKHWIDRELTSLQKLIDRASEKGWRRELHEHMERQQLLNTSAEQSRLLQKFPTVIQHVEESDNHDADEETKSIFACTSETKEGNGTFSGPSKDNPILTYERRKRVQEVVKTSEGQLKGKRPINIDPPEEPADPVEFPTSSSSSDIKSDLPSPRIEDSLKNSRTEVLPEDEGPSPHVVYNCDGGPTDKSVLTSFNDHIAYAIWNRQEDANKKLNTICLWTKLNEWDLSKEIEGVQSRVRATGLMPLMYHNYRYIDYVAVQAFVERWQPETNTFHLPFGEMTITLDDVKQILGVPVEGNCLNSMDGTKEIQSHSARKIASDLLGVSLAEVEKETEHTHLVRLQWIMDKCMGRANADSTEEELDICARGYILFLLGCVVFPDKSKNKISLHYLDCLKDMSKVGEIGWGMAILAYTYRQLGHASRSKVKWISGCLTLVVAWICEHFTDCVRAVVNTAYTEDKPRMCKWKPKQRGGGDALMALEILREKLDDLTEIDVCWDPYRDFRQEHLFSDVSYYCGLLFCIDIFEPYYPDRVLRQFGRVQRIPKMPIIQPLKFSRGKVVQACNLLYIQNRWQQENWRNHLLNEFDRSVEVSYPWECSPGYSEWFLKISHPIVQAPSQRRTPRKKHRSQDLLHAKLLVGVEKALTILDKALCGGEGADMCTLQTIHEILVDAKKVELGEKVGEEMEDRRKRHDMVE